MQIMDLVTLQSSPSSCKHSVYRNIRNIAAPLENVNVVAVLFRSQIHRYFLDYLMSLLKCLGQ